jgi:hypothetical protein
LDDLSASGGFALRPNLLKEYQKAEFVPFSISSGDKLPSHKAAGSAPFTPVRNAHLTSTLFTHRGHGYGN